MEGGAVQGSAGDTLMGSSEFLIALLVTLLALFVTLMGLSECLLAFLVTLMGLSEFSTIVCPLHFLCPAEPPFLAPKVNKFHRLVSAKPSTQCTENPKTLQNFSRKRKVGEGSSSRVSLFKRLSK